MAETRKKQSSNTSAAENTRRSTSRGKTSQYERKDTGTQADTSFFRAEVIMISTFAVAVFLFCSNFKICGVVGNFFRQLQLGMFGMIGYLFPVFLALGVCFYISNRGNIRAVLKMIGCTFCFLAVCGLSQMVFGGGWVEGQKIIQYYLISGEKGSGGGLLGGLLAIAFGNMLGTLGTYLLLLVLFIIGMVFITERSFVNFIKRNSSLAYQYAKHDVDRRLEEYEQQRTEKKRIREEQTVSGVDLSSTKLNTIPLVKNSRSNPAISPSSSSVPAFSFPVGAAEPSVHREEALEVQASKQQKLDKEKCEEQKEESIVSFEEGQKEQEKIEDKPESRQKKDIDFDAVEREAISARLKKQSESQVLNISDFSSVRMEREKEQQHSADQFTGRIHMPRTASVDEYDEGDVKRILAMQEEEKEHLPQSLYKEEDIPLQVPETQMPKRSTRDDLHQASYEKRQEENSKLWADTYRDMGVLDQRPDEEFYKAKEKEEVFVPEETKTVVTAAGKIIEAETSLLQKKLEEKKAVAVTGINTAPKIPDRQKIQSRGYGESLIQTAKGSNFEPGYSRTEDGKKEYLPRKDEFEVASRPGPTLVEQIKEQEEKAKREYIFPPTDLLTKGSFKPGAFSEKEYKETAIKLQQTLQNFGVGVTVTDISCGPAVTRYELHPEQGVKVSRIVSLQDDIKLNLAAADIRIEAPIPGKAAVGIEVPNKENSIVRLRDILDSEEFKKHPSRLAFAVGKDIGGKTVVTDIAKMPHLLIAGATGSGKSVCINTLIMSILYKSSPEDVKLIMVDPKVVELSVYNGIPHLLIPVVTDPKKASAALNWAVAEMTDRYKKFADYNVRDLKGYNAKIEALRDIEDENKPKKLPQIVIIVDELADLMMVAPGEVEDSICRLAQLARAAGIHLVIATQRPSVNVITGLIKANVPSRIAFAVSSGVDSRTIIDMNGAEKLLGKGDMLFYPSGIPKPIRVQGAFVSDSEVTAVVDFLTEQGMCAEYSEEIEAKMAGNGMDGGMSDASGERDAYFEQAGKLIIEKEKASIGMLQRVFKIGFNRAARIMDQLADAGVVGEEEGTKPRKVLMTLEEFQDIV